MGKLHAVLILAWIGAVFGPVIGYFWIRRLLRSRRIFLAWTLAPFLVLAWSAGV